MNNEEMKAKLIEKLDYWNKNRSHHKSNEKITSDDLSVQYMDGMINIAFDFGVITIKEKIDLGLKYFEIIE